jgi:hypothetical protein
MLKFIALFALVLAIALLTLSGAGGSPRHVPRQGQALPAGTPSAALPQAPANPDDARHIGLTLQVDRRRVALSGTAGVERGWPTEYPAGGSFLRVRLYDAAGAALYEADLPSPLTERIYGEAAPHGSLQLSQATIPLVLPLLPRATHVVVARGDRVVLTRDMRPALRAACAGDPHASCRDWRAAGGRR